MPALLMNTNLENKDANAYFARLQRSSNKNSLLKKYLTREVFEVLSTRETRYGGRLDTIMRSGIENTDSSIGIYATDSASYETFNLIFDPIIYIYHDISPKLMQPPPYFGNPNDLKDLDPEGEYILSTRIRMARSISGYPFNSLLTKGQYREIESKIAGILNDPSTGFEGDYRTLWSIPTSEKEKLIHEHILFKEEDRFLQSAGAQRHWPHGRGIFYNKAKTLVIWVNEEDHLRIISMESGADLVSIYSRLVDSIKVLESRVQFARDARLGYLTFCPTNIGTTIRASVHIRLPRLAKNRYRLEEIAKEHNLQIRGTYGEHSEVKDAVLDISNRRRCGMTEFQVLKQLQEGVFEIIKAERQEGTSMEAVIDDKLLAERS